MQPQHHMENINNNPSLMTEKRQCDLCGKREDLIDMKMCLDGNGYYCQECIDDGNVATYVLRNSKADKETITNYLNKIKA